jgi:hypothetical protein
MRTSRMRSQLEGHRVQDSNRDIANKLTYHQLLTLNHDLSRENQHLKNIGMDATTQGTDWAMN